jgi:hypothetical protein
MMIIGLHGKKRVGKDTCADYLVEKYGFTKIAFADGVRDALYALNPQIHNGEQYKDVIDFFGYEEAKDIFPDIRMLLQRLGTEVGRNILDPDLWVNLLEKRLQPNVNYVIPDVRFENEANLVRKLDGPVLAIFRQTGFEDDHVSEQKLPDDLIDHHIYNTSSLSDLYDYVDVVVRNYI